jgi:hypothetical protein
LRFNAVTAEAGREGPRSAASSTRVVIKARIKTSSKKATSSEYKTERQEYSAEAKPTNFEMYKAEDAIVDEATATGRSSF